MTRAVQGSNLRRSAGYDGRHVKIAAALLVLLLPACAWQMDMAPGQLDRALYRMTLTECHSRSRAAIGGNARDELERASLTHDCMRGFGE